VRSDMARQLRYGACGEHQLDRDPVCFLLVCLEVECQLASRLSLRICLSKARAGTMRRSVLTRPAVGPAV
jgi:hypothetical protein